MKRSLVIIGAGIVIIAAEFFLLRFVSRAASVVKRGEPPVRSASPVATMVPAVPPRFVRGIHCTAWAFATPSYRVEFERLVRETEINTLVVDVKESLGEVYVPGVPSCEEFGTYVPVIPDLESYVARLRAEGVYLIARIVVFKDDRLALLKPAWAVKDVRGGSWRDNKGKRWLDPFVREVRDYHAEIAERALALGFHEIQFDYIRFPSDGPISRCVYREPFSGERASEALTAFLSSAGRRIKAKGGNLSIDVFGLTTTAEDDMGIGQRLTVLTPLVDAVSPMVYPSHYARGSYGIRNPDAEPYLTVFRGLSDARRKLGAESVKLRPFLQDFSLGCRYGPREVRAQIEACYANDVGQWLLWNPRCMYTNEAVLGNGAENDYQRPAAAPAPVTGNP